MTRRSGIWLMAATVSLLAGILTAQWHRPTADQVPAAGERGTVSGASSQPPLLTRQGQEWDMEAGFVSGSPPTGQDCPNWAVATGWQAFVARGLVVSTCLGENPNAGGVHSGRRAQEIAFGPLDTQAGIFRRAETIPGHYYRVEAWGKHTGGRPPIELSLGIDLAGGEDWHGRSVQWSPWDEPWADAWVQTGFTVRATGGAMTVFLKATQPFSREEGTTLVDAVSMVDLGPGKCFTTE